MLLSIASSKTEQSPTQKGKSMVRKKAVSGLLAGALLAAMIPLSFGGTVQAAGSSGAFADVAPGIWYAGAVADV